MDVADLTEPTGEAAGHGVRFRARHPLAWRGPGAALRAAGVPRVRDRGDRPRGTAVALGQAAWPANLLPCEPMSRSKRGPTLLNGESDDSQTQPDFTRRSHDPGVSSKGAFRGRTLRDGSPPGTVLRSGIRSVGSACLAWGLFAACGASGVDIEGFTTSPSALELGEPGAFFEDPHGGGFEQEVHLNTAFFGRLVQVWGQDAAGRRRLMSDGFVVRTDLVSTAGTYEVGTNAVTGQDLLLIARNVEDESAGGGLEQFRELLSLASDNLTPMRVADVGTVGVFSMIPRNAAIVLQFDDLIDPRTIDQTTIRVDTGYPPSDPFEARVLIDRHHGARVTGVLGEAQFYPTRIIIDSTVTSIEAFQSNPPLPLNSVGMTPSRDANRANVRLRIPTSSSSAAGQIRIVRNLSGHGLATTGNGPVDFSAATRPLLRAFRAGGLTDPFQGFMRDLAGPRVIGTNPVTLTASPQLLPGSVAEFLLPALEFDSSFCAQTPEQGDVIVQGSVIAVLLEDALQPTAGGVATNLRVRLAQFPANWPDPSVWEGTGAGPAAYESAFDLSLDSGHEACFVRVSPRPVGYPEDPATGIASDASFRLRFSEPMDPMSLTAFDSLTLTRSAFPSTGQISTDQFVIGRVGQSIDLRDFTFVPDQPLNHVQGQSESYFLALASGAFAPRDLAGNVLNAFDQLELTVDASATDVRNGGRVSRFSSIDEEAPIAAPEAALLPEWGGQILFDPARQLIRPRPVVRSQVFVDRNQPTLQSLPAAALAVVTPLSNFGSKMQAIWRYGDCGFTLSDPTNINVDVEGLGWSPKSGSVVADAFAEFEIRLGHSRWSPDETIDPNNAWPRYFRSGVQQVFANNPLEGTTMQVVHARQNGYILNPADLIVAPSGARIMPYPLNRGVAMADRRTFLWRDTSIRGRSGRQGGGVDPDPFRAALGLPPLLPSNKYYPPNEVQTDGLPLLMEFRTYRDDNAVGLNGFDLNLAANSSSTPYFRAFSTGGVGQNGQSNYIDPDTEVRANGGFNPQSANPGQVTYGLDNSIYIGSMDLVVRVSRSHSIWFRASILGETTFGGRQYSEPTLEPRAEDQPTGTRIDVDYRGATGIVYIDVVGGGSPFDNDGYSGTGGLPNPLNPQGSPWTDMEIDAFSLDLYGDYYNDIDPPNIVHRGANANPGVTFLSGDQTWRSDVATLTGALLYQVRLTFNGNTATGLTPELSAFALSWTQ